NPGEFEQRIEIYTPPYLYGEREQPQLADGPETIERGESGTFTSKDAANIKSVRLMRPSASTHVTDVDQRSIALDFEADGDKLTVTVPKNRNLVQAGWYMLFVTDADGTPSKAQWVQVPEHRPGAPAPTRKGCPPSRRAPLSLPALRRAVRQPLSRARPRA